MNIARRDISNTLKGLYLPNELLVYLMYLDTDKNNENNMVFELNFLSANVSSWEVHRLNTMLTLVETRNVLPKDTSILKLNADDYGRNRVYK